MPPPEFDLLRDVQRVLRLYEVAFGALFGSSEIRAKVIEQMRSIAASKVLVFVGLLVLTTAALAQHNHAQHHANYKSWESRDGKNCCNDDDCDELAESDERTSGGILAVRISGEWCPVLPHHYLKKGNVPNAAVSHACVIKLGTPRAAGALHKNP